MRKRKQSAEPTPQQVAAAAEKERLNEFFRGVLKTLIDLTDASQAADENQPIRWETKQVTRPHREAIVDSVSYQFEASPQSRLWITYPNGECHCLAQGDLPEVQDLGNAIVAYDERYRGHFQSRLESKLGERTMREPLG